MTNDMPKQTLRQRALFVVISHAEWQRSATFRTKKEGVPSSGGASGRPSPSHPLPLAAGPPGLFLPAHFQARTPAATRKRAGARPSPFRPSPRRAASSLPRRADRIGRAKRDLRLLLRSVRSLSLSSRVVGRIRSNAHLGHPSAVVVRMIPPIAGRGHRDDRRRRTEGLPRGLDPRRAASSILNSVPLSPIERRNSRDRFLASSSSL